MKKLVYISPECFSDVDMPLIKELNKHYDLYWFVIFNDLNISYIPKTGPKEIEEYALKYNAHCKIKIRKGKLRNPKNLIFDYRILKEVLNLNPDIIYIESFVDFYFSILSPCLLPISKTIIGIHDVVPHVKHINILKKISNNLQRFFFKNFHLFSKAQERIFNEKYPRKKTFSIPLMLKSIEGVEVKKNILSKEKETIFLFWGHIRYNKGINYLIEAGNFLYEKGVRNFKIRIIGECDKWEPYQDLIKYPEVFELRIEKISNKEIPEVLQSSHFLVLPYRDVTQSGPLFFAYNYNLPVIASDLEGFAEYILNRETGFLFRSKDFHDLSNVMEQIVVGMDNDEYQKIKERLDDYIGIFSKEKIVENYKTQFTRVVK